MKNKGVSLIIILLIYIAAFGAGGVFFWAFPFFSNPLIALLTADIIATAIIFIFNLILKNASVYDPYWSVQPVFIIGAMYWFFGLSFQTVHLLVLVPLFLWSLRLTLNWCIGFENLSWEDWRYRDLKSQNPRISQFIVFTGIMLMPTCLVFLGLIPIWNLLQAQALSPVLPAIGGIVILLGTCLEHFADSQMRRFKKRADRTPCIDEGLWRYSRHPNYLGEILIWLGVFICGLVNFRLSGLPGVLFITLLFTFISIPMMERHILKKNAEYSKYQKIVSPLVFAPRKRK